MNKCRRAFLIAFGCLTLAACVSPRALAPVRLVTLSAVTLAPLAVSAPLAIAVGPVNVAAYLDQPALMHRTDGDTIEHLSSVRWAAPLTETVAQVLRKNLAQLLPESQVVVFPAPVNPPFDQRVVVDISRFDGSPGGTVTLEANWTLVSPHGHQGALASGFFQRTATHGAAARPNVAQPYAALLGELAVEIARQLADRAALPGPS